MKTTFVRTVVMSLTFAGFAAPSLIHQAPAKTVSSAKVLATASSFSGYPPALCAPSDPSHCGME
ncbi:MAG TPA: hypothetical protein VHY48_08665 [Acidobacteriaceae bacterium]|nr:hypothetical protein [Acidobacteriaceae bacterium]